MFHDRVPCPDYLRVFGCDAYSLNEDATKIADRGKKYVFVGYPDQQKGYLLYDPETGKVFTRRHVVFNEKSFGGRTMKDHVSNDFVNEDPADADYRPDDDDVPESDDDDRDSDHDSDEEVVLAPRPQQDVVRNDGLRRSSRVSQPRQFSQPMVHVDEAFEEANDDEVFEEANVGIDEVNNLISMVKNERIQKFLYSMPTDVCRSSRRVCGRRIPSRRRNRKSVSADETSSGVDSEQHRKVEEAVKQETIENEEFAHLASEAWLNSHIEKLFSAMEAEEDADSPFYDKGKIYEPTSYEDAMKCGDAPKWMASIESEIGSIVENGTFADTWELPEGAKAMGFKWVFKVKYKPKVMTTADEGTPTTEWVVDKYKSRLCCQGFHQRKNVDYFDTYAPVVRTDILRLLLALSLEDPTLQVHQMDVKTAFLNGVMKEDNYMKTPPGYNSSAPYVKLLRTLYGTHQAPREWHSVMDTFLQSSAKFEKVKACNCVYVKRVGGKLCIIALYVDDLILIGHEELLTQIKQQLHKRFKMSDLGELRYALGIEVIRDSTANTITLSQEKYIEDILAKYGFSNAKPVQTPGTFRLSKEQCPRSPAEREAVRGEFAKLHYRGVVGALLWICNTRPDISYQVSQVARFMEDPGREHYRAVKHLLKYLRGTSNFGLRLSSEGAVVLSGYADADFAGDIDTRRSTYGYFFTIGKGAVAFKSKLCPSVTLSSCESEYVAACVAAQEGIFLRMLLEELGFPQTSSTLVYEDNQSCIAHARNNDKHSRMKHIDVKKYYVRELVQAGKISHKYISTSEMVADIFTKPLGARLFLKFRAMLGVVPV